MNPQKHKYNKQQETFESPDSTAFEEIYERMMVSEPYQIKESVYSGFLQVFGDYNPLHTDSEFARSKGFKGKVMHGAILSGFLSHFIGMRFPGMNTLFVSSNMSFLRPCYLEDRITLEVTVTHKNGSLKALSLLCIFLRGDETVARSQVQVKLLP